MLGERWRSQAITIFPAKGKVCGTVAERIVAESTRTLRRRHEDHVGDVLESVGDLQPPVFAGCKLMTSCQSD